MEAGGGTGGRSVGVGGQGGGALAVGGTGGTAAQGGGGLAFGGRGGAGTEGGGGVGGRTIAAGGAVAGSGGKVAGNGGAGGPQALPQITGFTVLNQLDHGGLVRCDATGACFKTNKFLYKMAPNGTRFDFVFPDPGATEPGVNLPAAGIAIDGAGNVFTAAQTDIVEIAPGAATGKYLGVGGPTLLNPAIGSSLAVDRTGNLYLGVSGVGGSLGWLQVGWTQWVAVDPAYSKTAYDTVFYGNDVYFAGTDLALVRRAGASSLVTVADSPGRPNHLAIDSRGNLIGYFYKVGATPAAIYQLPAGGTSWTATSTLVLSTGNGGEATNFVVDEQDNVYIVASDASTPARSASLFKLAAGSLSWTKLFDIQGLLPDEACAPNGSLANDHIGHLILQCMSTLFRSQP